MSRHRGPDDAHLEFEVGHKRGHRRLSGDQALFRWHAVDRPFGVYDRFDLPHRFGRQRRARKLGQIEQCALLMRPTPASPTGPGLRACASKTVEPE